MSNYHGRDFSRDYIKTENINVNDKDVYLFGIYSGWSCTQIGSDFKAINKQPNKFYGFDSFVGLCPEAPNIPKQKDWTEGSFSSKEYFKNDNIKSIIESIQDNFYKTNGFSIDLIEGWYSDTLTEALVIKKEMKPACFVDIDCDLYISAYQALDWLAKNYLFKNTIVYFDDYIPDDNCGEKRALKEITKKYNLNVTKLFELPSYCQVVFRIDS